MAVNNDNLLYNSDYELDMVIYFLSNPFTTTIPQNTTAGSGAGVQTMPNQPAEPVVPVISYSTDDGLTWYSNGQYESYYDGTLGYWLPKLWAIAYTDASNNVHINWQSGPNVGTLTVKYRIYGILLSP